VWFSAGLLALVVARNAWEARELRRAMFALRCDEPVFDFGTAFSGGEIHHTFRVTNVSARDVAITSVVAECGCTTIASKGRIISPGESFDVPVKLSLDGAEARGLGKKIVIQFDGDPARKLSLKFVGQVEPLWTWVPPRVFFSGVPTGRPSSQIVTLARHPEAPPTAIRSLSTSRYLSAELMQESGSNNDYTWSLRLTTTPPLPPGRQDASLFIEADDKPGLSVAIPVTIIAADDGDST
jgi:hypothetical protein